MQFDIREYLNNRGVFYASSGKNVKKGNINIRCFNHPDRSNHLSINPQTLQMYCWICGSLGHVKRLIRLIEDCDPLQANKILNQFQTSQIIFQETQDYIHPEKIKFPSEFSKKFEQYHIEYLEERGFDYLKLKRDFNLFATPHYGQFKYRIICPIIMDGKIVSFTGRDVTDLQYLRYKNCAEHHAVLPRKELIFNYDNILNDTVIITEGPFDCMKIGSGSIALLSMAFSKEQVLKLKKKKIKKAFIIFDSGEEEQKRAKQLESFLTFIPEVFHVELPEKYKDPGELPRDEILALRREIFI